MLKPKDINDIHFSRAFKGYDADEVDMFLDRVTEDYTQLFRENAELMNKLEVLAAKVTEFKDAEERLKAAKDKVYRMAQDVAAKAKAEAAQTEREAKERAERIILEAKRECESQRRLYEKLQLEVTRFKAKAVSIFRNEIDQLNSLPDLQVDAKEELRIRADDIGEDDALSSPFVQEYKSKIVSPKTIDFGEQDDGEKEKQEEAARLKASADPAEDFTSDYVKNVYTREADVFSVKAESAADPNGKSDVPESEAQGIEQADSHKQAAEPVEADGHGITDPNGTPAFDVLDTAERREKPAFTVRRVTAEPEEPPVSGDDTVTVNEIADSIAGEDIPREGRVENGWYNETDEFDVVDTSRRDAHEKETKKEDPVSSKFGQLRFGVDYDLTEEDDGGSKGFGFFRKKK